jgi:hypothetical protein
VNLRFLLVLLAIVIAISCTKELMNVPKDALTIEKAKAWYEMQKTTPVLMLKSSKADKKENCIPDWDKASASSNDDLEVVEAPLTSDNFSYYTKESLALSKEKNEQGYLNSNSRIVIQKNKRTGIRDYYIMTIIGETDYLKTNNLKISKNSYLKKDKDFSGYVLYHNIDGSFVNGWKLSQGKVIGSLTKSSLDQATFRLKLYSPTSNSGSPTDCIQYTFYVTTHTEVPIGIIDGEVAYLSWSQTEILDQYIVCSTITGGIGLADPTVNSQTSGSTSSTNSALPIILAYLKENPCVNSIYSNLMTKNTLTNLVKEFQGFSNGNLTWRIGDLSSPNTIYSSPKAGETSNYDSWNVQIILDRNYCNTASGFAITQIIIHEALHAMFFEQLNSIGGTTNLSGNNFIALFNYYEDKYPNGFTAQHALIADQYRETIISGLKEYDAANKITGRFEDDYQALSWTGLMKTNAWNNFYRDNPNLAEKYIGIMQFFFGKKESFEDCGNKQLVS